MWAYPGKKLLCMGCEIGQWREWNYERSLDRHLLEEADHKGLQNLVRELNRIYETQPALWEMDVEPTGFQWIDATNEADNILSFLRVAPASGRQLVCVSNFSPVVRLGYRVGLPKPGQYRQILSTDTSRFGGSNVGIFDGVATEALPWQGQPYSVMLDLPPLSTIWLEAPHE